MRATANPFLDPVLTEPTKPQRKRQRDGHEEEWQLPDKFHAPLFAPYPGLPDFLEAEWVAFPADRESHRAAPRGHKLWAIDPAHPDAVDPDKGNTKPASDKKRPATGDGPSSKQHRSGKADFRSPLLALDSSDDEHVPRKTGTPLVSSSYPISGFDVLG